MKHVGDTVKCRDVFNEGQVGTVLSSRRVFMGRMYTVRLWGTGKVVETAHVRKYKGSLPQAA
jgi:hypothetical protein